MGVILRGRTRYNGHHDGPTASSSSAAPRRRPDSSLLARSMPRFLDAVSNLLSSPPSGTEGGSTRAKALVTGSVALGAVVAGVVLDRTRRQQLPSPRLLPRALDAEVGEMEIMEGRARYYHRPGTGVPIVLLHSVNAAASSFEMRPIFEHLARATDRPLYALDWLGFGRSDRPPVTYTPGLFQRQLRRFLSEHVGAAADLVALSLATEYAGTVANAFPVLVRSLVGIAPTALGADDEGSILQRTLVRAAAASGAFEFFFDRLTTPDTIRSFYARQIFPAGTPVPDALVDYAVTTAHARGATHAPRRFVEGTLFMRDYARRAYAGLRQPTLFVIPTGKADAVQDFERAEAVAARNPRIRLVRIATGLLPQWEPSPDLAHILSTFLDAPAQTPAPAPAA